MMAGEAQINARMDGTTEEHMMWRVRSLREALHDITTVGGDPKAAVEAMVAMAMNALSVDEANDQQRFGPKTSPNESGISKRVHQDLTDGKL